MWLVIYKEAKSKMDWTKLALEVIKVILDHTTRK